MPKLILANKSSADQFNKPLGGERLINCYPVPAPEGANAQFEIRNVPGTQEFATLPGPFLRAMRAVEGTLYAVTSGGLHRVSEDGTTSFLAAIPDDINTAMAGHRSAVTITAAGDYLVWDGDIDSPNPGRLSSVGSVCFLDQFTILSQRDGREVEWTEVGTPKTRNGLYFATAEAADDKIIRVLESVGYFVVFKERTSELWASTGIGQFSAFRRTEGGVIETGLLKFNLACRAKDALFAIGQDGVARLGIGNGAQVVSPPWVNNRIAQNDPTHVFYYEDRGHAFCCIRFSDAPACCYDAATGIWHERSSGVDHGPWNVIAAEYVYGRWHLATNEGRIYRLRYDPLDANGTTMRRTIVSRELDLESERVTVWKLNFRGRFGHSGVEETGPNWLLGQDGQPILGQSGDPLLGQSLGGGVVAEREARIWFRFSRDGGNVFGPAKLRHVGRNGQYDRQCIFRSMGQWRRMTVEINMTDPVPLPLFSEALVNV